jgi:hypothetical protein
MAENKPDHIIIRELNIPEQTYYQYKRRIQKKDEKIWEKVHIDSAKYRAAKLIQSLEKCFYINRQIAINEKEQTRDRMEASRTMCEAAANIFKIVNEGPTFRISLPSISHIVNVWRPKR